jgi:glycerophosphoryl diester phosphodiesterase
VVDAPPPGLALVAHAAGAIEGWPGSNSLEALENAVGLGFGYIELDMLYTSDGEIVLNHNWYHISNRIPGVQNGIMTHAEFMSHRIFGQFTPMDLGLLIDFLTVHPQPRIITDTKATEYAALYAIARDFPEFMHRFIPQAYSFHDVARIRALGFEDIILAIYLMDIDERDPAAIHQFAVEEGLYAVSMPESFAVPEFVAYLDMDEMRYFVHTIDSAERAAALHDMGFYGVYTGFLAYDGDGEIVYVSPPVWRYAQAARENMQNLNDRQRDLLPAAIFNKIGSPIYVHDGEVAPIWTYYLMSAPFESPVTQMAYLTAWHFDRYVQYSDRRFAQREFHLITMDGHGHILHGEDYELFIFRDMMFISEDVLRDIFGFEVLREGDFVVVVKEDVSAAPEELFEIAEILFD